MRTLRVALFVALCATAAALADDVAKADLSIVGTSLEVDRNPVITAVDIPSYVQTIFGGRTNEQAPSAPGLSVVGELTGPGIAAPISLVTQPGHRFSLPALHEKGEYALQNIRLVGTNGEFLQPATPSFAVITVSEVLQTEVRVRQLTVDELRERGISIDSRNFEVYEYTFIFAVGEKLVEIPYPVIVDTRTNSVAPVKKESPYALPPLKVEQPPRFQPPAIYAFEFEEFGDGGDLPQNSTDPGDAAPPRPKIPAALVVPTGFGVLHQFFAVILQVNNAAPAGSSIQLDGITATIDAPQQLRVAKVMPAVAIGQPVPIRDSANGTTYLVAGAYGKAEWTLEALKTGTHAVDITVNATYKNPGQPDMPLRGRVSTSLVVSDPRFQVNFSHPDTVRADETYTAYAFVTNLSPQRQHVVLDMSAIPPCSSGAVVDNICRVEGDGKVTLDLEPGQMTPVPYKLTSKITGNVFAGAGSANDEAIGVSVRLTMGVSASGIPLSPATLVMPHYARFLPSDFIAAQMQLLGLGYSLATAPLNQHTAKFPRVIKTDVFQRAQEIARAGQRVFITNPNENRDALIHLSLDLLGNIERVDQLAIAPELREWDQLRRSEASGRRAGAAMTRLLEVNRTAQQFADEFAAATSHRAPFLFALVEEGALSVTGLTTNAKLDVAAEAASGWVRTLPYSELTKFGASGQLAMIGRWSENVRISILPSSAQITLHLIWPDEADGAQLRTTLTVAATPGTPLTFDVIRGDRAKGTPVPQTPLRALAAAQDLHLDDGGHLVSLLFNRPVKTSEATKLRDRFALTINVPKANYSVTRRNVAGGELQIPGAALQADAKIVNLSFDKTLSRNAAYVLTIDPIDDALAAGMSYSAGDVVPRIDNDRPGAILTGRVLRGDNTAVPNAVVKLVSSGVRQYDVTDASGRFLYEFVPRDIDAGLSGHYELATAAEGKSASLEGTVRLPGEVHTVNLVFLGRGSVQGQVRYSDGEVLPNATVTIGSTLFNQFRSGTTDATGHYRVNDLPVGPLTFSVVDPSGRPTFAANHIRVAGEVVTQDLVIQKKDFPGTGTVRVTVRRSDTNGVVAGAHVGVYTQGYGLQDGYTDTSGFYEFRNVPAGLISILASDWSLTRESVGLEMELRADQTLEQTAVLRVPKASDPAFASLEGTVLRDDPASPNDASRDQPAGGAMISIGGLPPITANADGTYVYPDLPLSLSGRTITVFDSTTGRRGAFTLPTLVSGTNHFPMRLASAAPEGIATMRVRVYSATGAPVTGYRVLSPGYPPEVFTEVGNGVYELRNVRVPRAENIVAVPKDANGPFGQQMAEGKVRVDFHGQVGVVDLRLPGQGTVIAELQIEQPCSTPPCYARMSGPAAMSYLVWDEAEQGVGRLTIEQAQDNATNLVTFEKVPARQSVLVESVRHPVGYAATTATLAFDGDVREVQLRMKNIGDVTGRVLAHDRLTPISGALVKLHGGPVQLPAQLTNPDGAFRFPAVAANVHFRIVAEYSSDGVYRTGFVDGRTPSGGGPVSDLMIVMREQSTIEGQVVDQSSVAVPLARYWARELAWPYREFGTPTSPLHADIHGRFVIANVFTGPFRITAVSPEVQEIRGDYQGALIEEGDARQRNIRLAIGGAGTGQVSVTVVDPEQAFALVPNAEIALYRGATRFDFTTTDDNGAAFFDLVPEGTYSVTAYSKSVGRAGASGSFTVSANQVATQRIRLELRGDVSGDLADPEASGAPVKGMPVTLASGAVVTRASTDGLGMFEFAGVPEGTFNLTAFDLDSGRIAVGPPGLFISSLVTEQRNIHLELERYGQLTVKAYLPNDAGGAGELAPLVDVKVEQREHASAPGTIYLRELQGNTLLFAKMLRRYGYEITAKELGGEYRTVRASGSFPAATLAKEHVVVFPTSGSVEVRVVDGSGANVADAQVRINGRTLYTPSTGVVTLSGLPLGWITVQASKGNVAASAGGNLQSRTEPLRFTLNLGTTVSIAGSVEAEGGGPSVGTRVLLNVSSRLLNAPMRLEVMTDASGAYAFTGIPVGGTTLDLKFYGPDDTTIGATYNVTVADTATGTINIAPVRLDATPPRVLTIEPEANATNVSPSASIVVTFSEPIAASYLTNGFFKLIASDDSSQVQLQFQPSLRPDGTYVVRLVPPAPPASQKFPLKSNVLYRFSISQGVQDTTGNAMTAAVGSSFTTVNYTEPAVVKIDPPETLPIPSNVTFRIKFNKAVDITSFDQGGVLVLEKLDAFKGNPTAQIPLAKYLDESDNTTVVAAPQGVAIAESSFYRLTIAGARDTQSPPNVQKDARVAELFSFDTKKPVAKIVSPVAANEPLVEGVVYTAKVDVTDEGTTSASSDVANVDWFRADDSLLARVKTAPYSYAFQATGTSMTLKASATDLSGNTSPALDAMTWTVVPNSAPSKLTVTNVPASAYPGHAVQTKVAFEDEGVSVSVSVELRGTKTDGTAYSNIVGSKNVTRASTSVPFAETTFPFTLPLDLKDGSAEIVVTAKDSVNKTATAGAPLTILADTIQPVIVSLTPASETRYRYSAGAQYTIEFKVKDAETGVSRASIRVANVEQTGVTSTFDAATGIRTYRKTIDVQPKNADTRIAITATAYDHRDNAATATNEVIYERVDSAGVPRAAWITPLDGAALPRAQSGWLTTLRIRATDDTKVTSVRFESSAFATAPEPLTAPKSGTTDLYEQKVALTLGSDPFVITAIVSDGVPGNDVELPITIEPLDAEVAIVSVDASIRANNADQYANKSVIVRGPNARVYITTPITFKDLVLLDGALVSTLEETKLEVTVTDRLFVDADSRIDVSDKGYLGGLRKREDNSFTNTSRSGRTLSGNGATNADGSHAGIGGSYFGTTNATYGSITDPADFGAGGAAEPSPGTRTGSNGGGVARLRGGRFVVAGGLRADGGASGTWTAGAGGSVLVDARALITGFATRITANGMDEGASTTVDLGGGGGRLAVRVAERLDVDPSVPVLQARGGRNGTSAEGAQYVDGGAGTIHLLRPGATSGELIVSSFDERFPASTHRTMATPLAGALDFETITIGPRAFARFDVASTAPRTVDATAEVIEANAVPSITLLDLAPAANAQVPQGASITARYAAASDAGLREIRTTLGTTDVVAHPAFVTNITDTPSTIVVPANATPSAMTLTLRAQDRSGRTATSAPVTYTIVSNTKPIIETFSVTPETETYAGRTINVSVTATDDVEVKSIALTSSIGTVTAQPLVRTTLTRASRPFSIAVPANTPRNTPVVLTLTVADDYPERAPTTATHTVTIRKDEGKPSLTVNSPLPNAELQEAAGATFVVEATATDAEVAIHRVFATFNGTEATMTAVSGRPNVYAVTLPVPDVDGAEPVPMKVTVTATDYEPNSIATEVPISVKPLFDPNAPELRWVCTSPNAMYPAAYELPIRVFARGSSASNGVAGVTIKVGETVLTAASAGTDLYEAKYTIPPGTAAGTLLNVRVSAKSTSNNEAVLAGTITVVAGENVATTSILAADDLAFENKTFIVRAGGTLVVTGAHRLANVVVLDGGKLQQKHVDISKADLLTVDRLFVACNGTIDVSTLGFARNTSYAGAGTPDDGAGGSHIGRGGLADYASGGTFGNITRPMAPGGGGHDGAPSRAATFAAGGGQVRIDASGSVTIDGKVLANGVDWGAGGSIWIRTATQLAGSGSAEARPGTTGLGLGGGGAIAFEYATLSGSLVANCSAASRTFSSSRPGAAGTIYTKSASATFGDLVVDGAGVSTDYAVTDLPSFGRANVINVNDTTITTNAPWLSPALVGHAVRVFAADGTIRGTWRIASVTNDAIPVNGAYDVTTDAVAYDGYVVYSPSGIGGKRFVAARYLNGKWEYDTDSAFSVFIPQTGDAILAEFRKDDSRIIDAKTYRCAPSCGSVQGIPMRELAWGELRANHLAGADAVGLADLAEMVLRPDDQLRSILITSGGTASITLENGATVQAGDALHGVHRFDNVTLKSARVVTNDLLEAANTSIDATSSLVTGNVAAPVVDAAKITLERGLHGPVLVGAPGAVSDTEAVDVHARNLSRAVPRAPLWTNLRWVQPGTRGGLSFRRVENGKSGVYARVSALQTIDGSGYVSFGVSQTNREIAVALAPADTDSDYSEPGAYRFQLHPNGTYNIFQPTPQSVTGTYTTRTNFRIEKTPAAVRFVVDGAVVQEIAGTIPPLLFDVSYEYTAEGELHSIEYETRHASPATHHIGANADGSFRLPLRAAVGDAIAVTALDRHRDARASSAIPVATLGNDFGVASVTFADPQVIGGRSTTGTVTLQAAAGNEGAFVMLASGDANVVVPASVTIAPLATSATFAVTTKPVSAQVDAAVTATYGGQSATGTLRVVKDTTAPSITVTQPAPNAQFNEGSTNLITVQATITDDASGVASATATLDGQARTLTKNATTNVWTGQVPSPFIDGTTNVTMQLTVTAADANANSASVSVPVVIKPNNDPNAPTISWTCGNGGVFPAGTAVKLRANASAANASNPLQRVEFVVDDGTPIAAASIGSGNYEATWNVPATPATFSIRAIATATSGLSSDVRGTVSAVVVDNIFSANTTIAEADTTWDNKAIAVTAGTLTINGAHSFTHLLILGGSVTHAQGNRVAVTVSGSVYVACAGVFDAGSRGYASNVTYPGATLPGNVAGGSHIGRGGGYEGSVSGSTYGSVYRPQEAGGGSNAGGAGGGVIRIIAGTMTVDGTIRANGTEVSGRTGAGGSVWITANKISGSGIVETNGADGCYGKGGGGAIAIEYSDATSVVPRTSSRGTTSGCSEADRFGGPGSIVIKGPQSTYGSLTIDNQTVKGSVELPSLGRGTAQSGTAGNVVVLDRATDVPAYFAGHYVEIGTKGMARIASVSGKTITLDGNAINAAPGDTWQGVYPFEAVTIAGGAYLTSNDPIRLPSDVPLTLTGPTSGQLIVRTPIDTGRIVIGGGNVTLEGKVKTTSLAVNAGTLTANDIDATTMTIASGATVTQTGAALRIVAQTLAVAGIIDVSGDGYGSNVTYPGATLPGNVAGGSHIGRGGGYEGSVSGSTYGSVYRPQEAGGGSNAGGAGGGVIRIIAGTMTLDGTIRANGVEVSGRTGAGGSVWITATKISGSGIVETNGVDGCYGKGGGGAIAIEYSDATSVVPRTSSRGTTSGCSESDRFGGPGSIVIKGPQSTYGSLTIDNQTVKGNVELPSLGRGTAQSGTAGNVVVLDRATDVPAYFAGHYVEIGAKGMARIGSVSGKSITLDGNAINAAPGDTWQGVYPFDAVTIAGGAYLTSNDPIRLPNDVPFTLTGPTSGQLIVRTPIDTGRIAIGGGNVTLEGKVKTTSLAVNAGTLTANDIDATTMTIASGATVTQTGAALKIVAQTLAVAGIIDVSGDGYGSNVTYPGATLPGNVSGGSHIGRGGGYEGNVSGSTYGSVYRPQEAGGGSNAGGAGGGVIRISAGTMSVDGTIRANGMEVSGRTGAGGSVWITANKISGTGIVETNGVDGCYGKGGGGAIAIEYSDATSVVPRTSSRGTTSGCSESDRFGGPGSIVIKGPQSTYGALTIDNQTVKGNVELPSLGRGTAQSGTAGNVVVLDRATDVPAYFAGHYVEIGAKGMARIGSVSGKSITLEGNAINAAPGDTWQGVYPFDAVTIAGGAYLTSNDPIRLPNDVPFTLTGPTSGQLIVRTPIDTGRIAIGGGNVTLEGNVKANDFTVNAGTVNAGEIEAASMTIATGATLSQGAAPALKITAATLTVRGTIDANGDGYASNATYPGATLPGAVAGGSHIGRGGGYEGNVSGSTYGSLHRPQEAGGGSNAGGAGGGVIRINAGTVTLDGTIRANGVEVSGRTGAGGSVWITATKISGTGIVETNGAEGCYGKGGGGAIAIEYSDATSVVPRTSSRGTTSGCSEADRFGGPGSIVTRGPANTYGELLMDAANVVGTSVLPALGTGTARNGTSGATLVTDRATDVPPYFFGHFVEIRDAAGAEKGIWRISAISGRSVTLAPNASETIALQPGDQWRGAYRFDKVTLRNRAKPSTADRVIATQGIAADATSALLVNDAAPQFPAAKRAQIVVVSNAEGDFVSGPVGAVSDSDVPIKLAATNTRTAQTYSANANADGSFRITVGGAGGDTFTLVATDSHAAPLSTSISVNGAITDTNAVASLTIQPNAVTGGASAIATLRLAQVARSGGVVVSIASSHAIATVPATITIPAGSATAQFNVTTTSPATTTGVTISATYNATQSAVLTVAPSSATLVDVALAAASTEGGTTLNGTVVLGSAAPASGAVVFLTSSDPTIATVPESVVVAGGATSASFPVTTTPVAATARAIISGSYGTSDSATLDVTPCAAMGAVAPASGSVARVFVDDDVPAGASSSGDATFSSTYAATGTKSLHFAPPTSSQLRQHFITAAPALAVAPSDTIVLYALVNPCKPPRQLVVTLSDGTNAARLSWGESVIAPVEHPTRIGTMPKGGVWTRLEVLASSVGVTAPRNFTALSVQVEGGELWIDTVGAQSCATALAAPPQYGANEQVWFDDALPAGATALDPSPTRTAWNWSAAQVASGTLSHLQPAQTGLHEHAFQNATDRLVTRPGDVLFAYVFLDRCNPPKSVMLTWNDGASSEYRAYWGEKIATWGTDGTVSRYRVGPLPELGAWVRLEVPVSALGLDNASLSGAGFVLFDGQAWFDRVGRVARVNLARGKTATQISTLNNDQTTFGAMNAVDGNIGGNHPTDRISHTNSPNAWWQVDLGAIQPVDEIQLWNRTDCCMTRLRAFSVYLSDTPLVSLTAPGVSQLVFPGTADRSTAFRVGRTARYVRVQQSTTEHLHMGEVQVWAPWTATPTNAASGSNATTSSTILDTNAQPWFAVNGDGNSIAAQRGSVFTTASTAQPWWEVDLGSIQPITSIDLLNRIESGQQLHLTDFYVLVSDVAFPSKDLATTLAQPGVFAAYSGTAQFISSSIPIRRSGRYVRVQRRNTGQLSFSEVRVWSPRLLTALMAPAEEASE